MNFNPLSSAPARIRVNRRGFAVTNVLRKIGPHIPLLFFSVLALFPIFIIVINAFKSRQAIFDTPMGLPNFDTFSLEGFETVFGRSNFPLYFVNSLIVTLISIGLIMFLGAMAAWALSEYRFWGNSQIGIFFALGIMIPTRLGTVSLLRIFVSMGLIDTLAALILVYTAQGFPLTVFIVRQFMKQIPKGLKDAGRIDGANEYHIFWLILPLIRPVLATIAVFTMVPIWNDLWFPLILTSNERTRTIILGAQQFLGQFVSDWNAVIAALFLAMLPVLILFVLFSRQLIAGLTTGSIKQ